MKYGMLGLSAVTVGSAAPFSPFLRPAHAQENEINLGMTTAEVEMVDGKMVPHWVYTVNGMPTLPGPVIFAFAKDRIVVNVTNAIPGRARRFAIVGTRFNPGGIPADQFALLHQTTDIPFGETGSLTLLPGMLKPGTYLYKDPTLDPISRVLGLHGVLVVLPSPSATNPYGMVHSTPNVLALFNKLGTGTPRDPEALFPGQPWFATTDANPAYNHMTNDSDHHHYHHFVMDPNGPQSPVFERFLYRSRIWLHSSIDPELNREVIEGGFIPDPATVSEDFVPQYFSINGRQGAFAMHSPDVSPHSTVGEPHVIRLVNAGLVTHSPHSHGNHAYIISINNVVGGGGVYLGNDAGSDNVVFVDTMTLEPEDRIDWVMPFIRPPDIPMVLEDGTIYRRGTPAGGRLLKPLDELIPQELNQVIPPAEEPTPGLNGVPQNPLGYPMHSHMELDQTAAGGNYPQGATAGWEITGEFGAHFNPPTEVAATIPGKKLGGDDDRGSGQGA
jgi:hypothetical protein